MFFIFLESLPYSKLGPDNFIYDLIEMVSTSSWVPRFDFDASRASSLVWIYALIKRNSSKSKCSLRESSFPISLSLTGEGLTITAPGYYRVWLKLSNLWFRIYGLFSDLVLPSGEFIGDFYSYSALTSFMKSSTFLTSSGFISSGRTGVSSYLSLGMLGIWILKGLSGSKPD